jgi:hypothetical protein
MKKKFNGKVFSTTIKKSTTFLQNLRKSLILAEKVF